jgi:hypothetical protein
MSKAHTRRLSLFPTWLRHRSLIVTEAMLAVGLGQFYLNDWLLGHSHIAPWVKIMLGMAMIIGGFGGVLFWARRYLTRTIVDTHSLVRSLPFPTPKWLFHTLCLAALYAGYTVYWGDKIGGARRVLPTGLIE